MSLTPWCEDKQACAGMVYFMYIEDVSGISDSDIHNFVKNV